MLVNLKVNMKIENNYKRVKPTKELLEKLFLKNNLSRKELSNLLNIEEHKIKYLLRKHNIKKPRYLTNSKIKETKKNNPIKKYSKEKELEVIKLYNNGKTYTEIYNILNIGLSTISRILNENNINIRSRQDTWANKLDYNIDDIINLYNKGYTTNELGEKYDIHRDTVRRILKKNNVYLRTELETNLLKNNIDLETDFFSKVGEETINSLNKKLGISKPSLLNFLHDKYPNLKNKEETMKFLYGVEHYNSKDINNPDIWFDNIKFKEWLLKTFNKFKRKLTAYDVSNYFNVKNSAALNKLHDLELDPEVKNIFKIKTSYLEPIVEDWIKKNVSSIYEKNKYYDFLLNGNGNMMQLDFFFPELKIAVEVNDNWSHNPEFRVEQLKMDLDEAQNYEQIKSDLCEANGIRLIHLWEDDFDNIDSILGDLVGK